MWACGHVSDYVKNNIVEEVVGLENLTPLKSCLGN